MTYSGDGGEGTWPGDVVGAWFILRTRSRQEKILSRDLRARGVAHFLPLVKLARSYAGRRAVVEAPLFPGWLFLHGRPADAEAAERTERVSELIGVSDQRQLDHDLHHLRRALHAGVPMDAVPYPREGVGVEVCDGPLRGLRGVIENIDGRNRIVLRVQALGQAVSVEVDPSFVRVLK